MTDFFERVWQESWIYIKTVVDVVREPVLILDKDLRVLAANDPFYRLFRAEPSNTTGKVVYELGNGQWNIPSLRRLLEDILPKNTLFKGFEVAHEFPLIGRRIMLLNARQIQHRVGPAVPSIILLAIEDVTDMMTIADRFTAHTNQLEAQIKKLEEKINNTPQSHEAKDAKQYLSPKIT